jgi:hypothetical protein
VVPRAGLDTDVRGKTLLPLRGIEPQSPGRPIHSQTLSWLSYPPQWQTRCWHCWSSLRDSHVTVVTQTTSSHCWAHITISYTFFYRSRKTEHFYSLHHGLIFRGPCPLSGYKHIICPRSGSVIVLIKGKCVCFYSVRAIRWTLIPRHWAPNRIRTGSEYKKLLIISVGYSSGFCLFWGLLFRTPSQYLFCTSKWRLLMKILRLMYTSLFREFLTEG